MSSNATRRDQKVRGLQVGITVSLVPGLVVTPETGDLIRRARNQMTLVTPTTNVLDLVIKTMVYTQCYQLSLTKVSVM